MAAYTLTFGRHGIHYLKAPYSLLVHAFGNDGTVSPRDDYKQMCQWDVSTDHGPVEVYDYKVGRCYAPDGLGREQITVWNVQGPPEALNDLRALLDRASS